MREKQIEQRLMGAVRKLGGLCLKFVSPGWSGAPDRLVLLPEGRVMFVEVKAPSRRPRPLQERRLRQLREMGFHALCVDSKAAVDALFSTSEQTFVRMRGDAAPESHVSPAMGDAAPEQTFSSPMGDAAPEHNRAGGDLHADQERSP